VIGPRRAPGPCWRCKHSFGADFSVGYGGGPTQQAGRTVSFTRAGDADRQRRGADNRRAPASSGPASLHRMLAAARAWPAGKATSPAMVPPDPRTPRHRRSRCAADFTIYQTQPLDYVRWWS